MANRQLTGAIVGVVIAALAYTAACPPYELSLAAWLVPAALMVPGRRLAPARAFLCGVVFALLIGYGITGWAFHASLEYFAFNRLLAGGFVVAVWLLYGGIQYGAMLAAYAAVGRRLPVGFRPVVGAWLWVVMELMRAALFTGMPWELLGHTQFRNLLLLQVADLGGVYAVSFVLALVSLTVGELLVDPPAGRSASAIARRLAPATLLLLATLGYGFRCRALYDRTPAPDAPTVAVVQANIPNAFRWKRAFFERTLATYARLTDATRAAKPDLIVWPENAVNFYIDQEPMLRLQLANVAALAGEGMLVGGPRLAAEDAARNAAYLLDVRGKIQGTYDKQRLVPFAEYNPLPTLARDDASGPAYTAGGAAEPLRLGSTRLGTTICYEVLFPHLVRDVVRRGAEVLVNLTNDTWLDRGDGAAPRQHFSMAIFRAVESRRYLVRAAASGASGFVNPYGETYGIVAAATEGSAVARVEPRHQQTPYVRWGERWVLVVGVLLGMGTLRRSGRAA
jgi:apolipoprotein N-acyltransferase